MPDDQPTAESDALADALDSYLTELHAGRAPDRQQWLARHPEIGAWLDCLEDLDRLAPPQPAPAPTATVTEFGRYELLGEIGRGGMGVVYKARQKDLDRVVALKIILAGQLASPEHVQRFVGEARAAAKLQHSNIVRVHEAGEIRGQHYFAMEYIAGCDLADLISRGPLQPEAAARLMVTVARAVEYLHSQGIVHRDLKPSNILLDEKGQPYVTDFGLARLLDAQGHVTRSGLIAGTPSYMSPEQASGHAAQAGPPSDVYSLGAILYELLTARPPFRADSPLDTLVQVVESEPTSLHTLNPRVPRELAFICMRCLEKSPGRRYATAAALADDLERFLKGEPVEARAMNAWQRARRWARRQPALASRLGGLAVCAAIAQASYHVSDSVTLSLHTKVMSVLGAWAVVSALCQWLMGRERWAGLARFVWAGADAALLTAALWIDDALNSPLIAAYLVLIAASGLWFRVPLVVLTTAMSAAGYGWLVLDDARRYGEVEHLNWHLIFVAALVIAGFAVSYQVHRVRALSRYYERRPLP
jgi:serine/threonine-protein kinase